MRIGVLGGCGDMGSRTVEVLAAREEVAEVLVLDHDTARGRALEERHQGVQALAIDATDRSGLVRALGGLDAVANALGPFYLFERPLAAAAIDAGVPYVSISDDHDATAAVFELDEAARRAGVAVLTGLGWTPGLTNLAARRIHDELGGLDAVRLFWAGTWSDVAGEAVVLHLLHVCGGYVPVLRGGLAAQVPAGTGPEPVHFPAPFGSTLTAFVGHPEPVTLPRFLPGLRRVDLKGGLGEPHLGWLTRTIGRLRLASTHRRRELLYRLVMPLMPALERLGPRPAPASAWRVDGAHAGRRRSYAGVGRMRDLTGVPLAIGALLLARGAVTATGVLAPEAAGIPHEDLWQELAEHGITAEPGEPRHLGVSPDARPGAGGSPPR